MPFQQVSAAGSGTPQVARVRVSAHAAPTDDTLPTVSDAVVVGLFTLAAGLLTGLVALAGRRMDQKAEERRRREESEERRRAERSAELAEVRREGAVALGEARTWLTDAHPEHLSINFNPETWPRTRPTPIGSTSAKTRGRRPIISPSCSGRRCTTPTATEENPSRPGVGAWVPSTHRGRQTVECVDFGVDPGMLHGLPHAGPRGGLAGAGRWPLGAGLRPCSVASLVGWGHAPGRDSVAALRGGGGPSGDRRGNRSLASKHVSVRRP